MPKISLTDRKVHSLKPAAEGKRDQYMDTVIPGFGVRVTDKGVRTFIFQARFPGSKNPARRELGQYPAMSLEDARIKASEWRTMVKLGTDPALIEDRARAATLEKNEKTFGVVAEVFIADALPRQRSGKITERDIRRHFIPAWGKRPIADITDLDVLKIVNEVKRSRPAMAHQLLSHAKRIFSWAIDARVYLLKHNPCATIKPEKLIGKRTIRQRVLSDDELFALWRAVKREEYPFRQAYQLLLFTALRLNEVAAVERREVDYRTGVWTIPAERMKGKNGEARAHAVPLTTDVLALFNELPKFNKGEYLLSHNFGESPVWMTSKVKDRINIRMKRTLKAMARKRGDDPRTVRLVPWVNHDIRRTVRSRLSRFRLVSQVVAEAILAHRQGGIVGVYDTHEYLDEKREALELWAATLRQIVEPPPRTDNVIKLRNRK